MELRVLVTEVKTSMLVILIVTPCRVVGRYERTVSTFSSEDGGITTQKTNIKLLTPIC
jgi:hypothetical protein